MADDRCQPYQSASPGGGSKGRQSGCVQDKRGLNTKIHLAVDAHGMPVRVLITEGTRADCKEAVHLIEGFSARPVFVRRIGKTKPPVILGVSKKSFSNRITLLCYDKGGLATTNKNIGGFCNKYRHKTFITFEMEIQILYCICAQISKTGNIWKAKS